MGLSASQTRPVLPIISNQLKLKQIEQTNANKVEEKNSYQLKSEIIEDKANISKEALELLNSENK